MKIHTNSITLIAIISSIVLLLALEIFWLRMEFNDEQARFNRETQMLFRNTVFELNDSLIQKNIITIEAINSDASTDTVRKERLIKVWVDSLSSAHIYRSNSSQHRVLEPVVARHLSYGFRIDSLDKNFIHKKYIEELGKAGFELPFRLIFLSERPEHRESAGIFSNDVVHTPSGTFKLEFSDSNWLILKNISPQIIFSIIVTLLVVSSFILVYRNLLLQQRLVTIKDGLISNISHELKTPITTVGVALEGLKNFKGQNDITTSHEYLAIAEHELKRLSILTDKVLRTSLGDQGNAAAHIHAFDFDDLVKEVVVSFKLLVDKKGATIKTKIENGSFVIEGDRDHLSNVLFNLLDNALKYSGENASILIHLAGDKDKITVSVQDNGIGIEKGFHSKVFEKFFRIPTGDLHKVKGHGLGLSYVKQVVRSHGGKITLESKPGQGAQFNVSLPRIHAKK